MKSTLLFLSLQLWGQNITDCFAGHAIDLFNSCLKLINGSWWPKCSHAVLGCSRRRSQWHAHLCFLQPSCDKVMLGLPCNYHLSNFVTNNIAGIISLPISWISLKFGSQASLLRRKDWCDLLLNWIPPVALLSPFIYYLNVFNICRDELFCLQTSSLFL